MALITVIFIHNKANIYALGAILEGLPINLIAFGLDKGITTTILISIVYGGFFVQIFQVFSETIRSILRKT